MKKSIVSFCFTILISCMGLLNLVQAETISGWEEGILTSQDRFYKYINEERRSVYTVTDDDLDTDNYLTSSLYFLIDYEEGVQHSPLDISDMRIYATSLNIGTIPDSFALEISFFDVDGNELSTVIFDHTDPRWNGERFAINVENVNSIRFTNLVSNFHAGNHLMYLNEVQFYGEEHVTNSAPEVSADDENNTIVGIDNPMEYKVDEEQDYTVYDGTLPDLSGDHTVYVRVTAVEGISQASEATVLAFTVDEIPELPIPSTPAVSADDENNTIVGIDDTMEYKVDEEQDYTVYDGTLPDLSGDHTVYVRVTAVEGISQASEATVLAFTADEIPELPIPSTPAVSADDENNTIVGIDDTMEYKVDEEQDYTVYDGTLPNLSGDHTVYVRVTAVEGVSQASEATILTFTENISESYVPAIEEIESLTYDINLTPYWVVYEDDNGIKTIMYFSELIEFDSRKGYLSITKSDASFIYGDRWKNDPNDPETGWYQSISGLGGTSEDSTKGIKRSSSDTWELSWATEDYVNNQIRASSHDIVSNNGDGTVYYVSENLSLEIVSDKNVVVSSEEFTVEVWLEHGSDIYAEDFSLTYDDTLFEFVSATTTEGLNLYHQEHNAGHLRYIIASKGRDYGINENAVLVQLTFRARELEGNGTFVIDNGIVADKDGNEFTPVRSGSGITVYIVRNADVNNDGRYSLADLAIASYDMNVPFGEIIDEDSDVNHDGEINELDLSEVVSAILSAD
ncbi:DUF4073 domain-containing protein [Chengkuizengella axinellae]|uniref:DUF4073 domain-containing protein n=1 Tax=Chengkuizengella axinellae TaxID=3064388 RepID=A0ABT9J5C4_9BACL|nr:DUF4073 domain-containing protein [Chengkuizengella sp. 2205SS18-9]MDP5276149.1 DUF4073 domain-containing protein [Chengkuizengella sp. 2205SS18-9]